MPPLRILVVLEYFPPHIGGVESLFAQVTTALARAGHRVTVITLKVPGTSAYETRDGIEIMRIRTPEWARRAFFTLLAIPSVVRQARHADLLHAATPNAALATWIGARIARKPAVHTVHEVFADLLPTLPGLHPLRVFLFRTYEWGILRLPFAHYVCDSHFTRERLVRLMHIPPSRASVVYPAVDYTFWERSRHQSRNLHAEFGLDDATFLTLYFGRPGFLKGVEYLIDAAMQMRERLPASRLILLLDRDPPDHYRRLRERITRLGLDDYVIVRDPVPRAALPSYLIGADCVVVPSLSEGFGYAAIEAATLGCPLVVTTGHAVQEVLNGRAVFVPPRDPAALAEAIVSIARTPPAYPAPPRFTIAAHVTAIETIYQRLQPSGRR